MKNEYISVKEFSKRANITPQAIYQRLNKDFKPYLKVIDGKKMLNISALSLFDSKEEFKEDFQFTDKELIKSLNETLKTLQSQLEVKDKQISELNERLSQSHKLIENQQILLKHEQDKVLLLEQTKEEQEERKPFFKWFKVK